MMKDNCKFPHNCSQGKNSPLPIISGEISAVLQQKQLIACDNCTGGKGEKDSEKLKFKAKPEQMKPAKKGFYSDRILLLYDSCPVTYVTAN